MGDRVQARGNLAAHPRPHRGHIYFKSSINRITPLTVALPKINPGPLRLMFGVFYLDSVYRGGGYLATALDGDSIPSRSERTAVLLCILPAQKKSPVFIDQSDWNTAVTHRANDVADPCNVLEAESKANFISATARMMIKIESGSDLTVKAERTPILTEGRLDQTRLDVGREIELLGDSLRP